MARPRSARSRRWDEIRAENADLVRQNRILKARFQEWDERYEGPIDAEGVGGRPAVVILRDKNLSQVFQLIDTLPSMPWWTAPDNPDGPRLGFWGSVAFIETDLAKAVDAMFLAEPHHPNQVRDYHRAKMWLTRPFSFHLLRTDYVGFRERTELKSLIESLGYARSVQVAFATSQETDVQPTEAERKRFG